jgi:hypothetical protein
MTTRYQVKGQYMDGIAGWFVVDTHHDFYKRIGNNGNDSLHKQLKLFI